MRRRKALVVFLAAAISATGFSTLVTAGITEPCDDVLTLVGTDENHVCYDQDVATTAPRDVDSAELFTVGDVDFITFTVDGYGRHTTLTHDTENWSDPLPSPWPENVTGTSSSPYEVVHLRTPMIEEWQTRLRENETRVTAPLSHHWYVMNTSDAATDPADHAFVDDVGPFNRTWKLARSLDNATGDLPVLVQSTPKRPGGYADSVDAIRSVEGAVVQENPAVNVTQANVSADRLDDLVDYPSVFRVEPGNLTLETHMSNVRNTTGAEAMHEVAADIAPEGFTGEGVTGMIMDTEFDPDQGEIEDSIAGYWPSKSEIEEGSPSHGTPVFSIAHANGDSVTDRTGMAPNVSSVMADADDQHQLGYRYRAARNLTSYYDGAFQSFSWGWVASKPWFPVKPNVYSLPAMEIDSITYEQGVLVFQSMGNDGPAGASYEAVAKDGVSVGGLYHYNDKNRSNNTWDFNASRSGADDEGAASTGPTWDCRRKPDIVAPYDRVSTFTDGSSPTEFERTSASAPVAAGAGALVYEMYEAGVFEDASGENTSGTPSPAMAKALLVNSAHTFPAENVWDDDLLGDGACGTDDRSPQPRNSRDIQGAGQPNLTVYEGEAGASTWTLDEDFALDSGDYVNATVTLPDWAGAVRVSLTWTDPPTQPILNNVPVGNLTAAADGKLVRGPESEVVHRALVNDLDLVVEGPDGTTYPGNHGRANDTESDAGNNVEDRDRVNNLETVSSTEPEAGSTEEWTVQVQATSIMQDAAPGEAFGQPFALVVRPVDVPGDGSSSDDSCYCGGGGGSGGEMDLVDI